MIVFAARAVNGERPKTKKWTSFETNLPGGRYPLDDEKLRDRKTENIFLSWVSLSRYQQFSKIDSPRSKLLHLSLNPLPETDVVF